MMNFDYVAVRPSANSKMDAVTHVGVNVSHLAHNNTVSVAAYPVIRHEDGFEFLCVMQSYGHEIERMPRLNRKRLKEVRKQVREDLANETGLAHLLVRTICNTHGFEVVTPAETVA